MSYSSIALLYYDYFLTFPAEVKYIWSRRFTISTILYICCRYALLANLLYLFAVSNVISKYCGTGCCLWFVAVYCLIFSFSPRAIAIFTARTWAVCGKSRVVIFGLGALAVICIAIDFVGLLPACFYQHVDICT
ncbi:hypothetical protein M405DRAFT_853799 [Rhizopogon salebrosus TDB-379]|nr:hypothetical protein M405DRAFT_853799 [Rhizopogon salebrosus TDB-379]